MILVMKLASKTNAVRIIEKAGIPYSEFFYEYQDDSDVGLHAAAALGYPPNKVFKTLVTKGIKSGIHVFCIPVSCELDLKKAAKAATDKKIEMIPVKDLLSLTGYIRGGCSPVGLKKQYPVHIDASALNHEQIALSAGERGHQVILSPLLLADLIKADFHQLTV